MSDKDFETKLSEALRSASEGFPENPERLDQVRHRRRWWQSDDERQVRRVRRFRRFGVAVVAAGGLAGLFGLVLGPQLQQVAQDSMSVASNGQAGSESAEDSGAMRLANPWYPKCPERAGELGTPKVSKDRALVPEGAIAARLCVERPKHLPTADKEAARRTTELVDRGVGRLVEKLNQLPPYDPDTVSDSCGRADVLSYDLVLGYPSGREVVVTVRESDCALVARSVEAYRTASKPRSDGVVDLFHELVDEYGDPRHR